MDRSAQRSVVVAAMLVVLAGSAVLVVLSAPGVYFLVFLLVIAMVLGATVIRHARTTAYRCPECTRTFSCRPLTDFVSPHYPHKKLLKCPHCGHTDWCQEVDRSTGSN